MSLRVGSLFSGIGGLDLGLERAGMEIVWQVELDPWRRAQLAKRFPDAEQFADIKALSGRELAPVDLIAGGPPCQPVSLASRYRRGTEDERWLWHEFERIISVLRPKYVLVENVPGLLSVGFGDVLGGLAACGYDAEWDCLPAAAFGAPHIRDRVFIVAYPAEAQRDPRPKILDAVPGSHKDRAPQYHPDRSGALVAVVADTEPQGLEGAAGPWSHRTWRPQGLASPYSDLPFWPPRPNELERWVEVIERWPEVKPAVRGVANGIPDWRQRIAALGDAVVPQVAEWIGRRILAVEATNNARAAAR